MTQDVWVVVGKPGARLTGDFEDEHKALVAITDKDAALRHGAYLSRTLRADKVVVSRTEVHSGAWVDADGRPTDSEAAAVADALPAGIKRLDGFTIRELAEILSKLPASLLDKKITHEDDTRSCLVYKVTVSGKGLGLSELAKELEAVMEEKDVKGFTVAFAKALAVFGRLPQHTTDVLGGNLLGNNLGLCMTKVIADCKAAGFACYVDATGLHFAEKAVKS
jgi:hypothetical protein